MSTKFVALLALAVQVLLLSIPSWAGEAPARILVSCAHDNDLFQILQRTDGLVVEHHASAAEAVRRAPRGAAVMILADGYPGQTTSVGEEIFKNAAAKRKLRLFVEYPAALPGVEIGAPISTHVERVVVDSDFFGNNLKRLRIVSVNGLHYVPVKTERAHLVAARVAGFDRAVYGLPEKTSPILFEIQGRDVMVATTSLSRFVTGRYAPQQSWRDIWSAILTWLAPGAEISPLKWTPTVRATYARDQKLPSDYELQAIRRGLEWYRNAKMIVHPSFAKQVVGKNWVDSLPPGAPMGDGTLGSMEAVLSVIHHDGSQRISSVQRIDCICETAMAMALAGGLLRDEQKDSISTNLLDYAHFVSEARKKERGDPDHGAYGLIAWGITNPAWYKANYGDDNARVMLSTLAAAGIQKDGRWDEAMMMCLLANLRTAGQLGFRGDRVDIGALKDGWGRFHARRVISFAPHFECYLWACYLWAYEQTRDELFLHRAATALKMTMEQYTDGWRWTNGLAQEKARILLPLAWLVRVSDTPEHRAMLRKAADGLLALQDECGAIREELGLPGRGMYPPPPSNATYGTNEASLIAENGDPVADLLYTTNFALLGLHEAAAATADRDIVEAEDKLAEFLCRIQVKSDAQPAVNGGWFRAFDFGRWEHWGCNADHGWGAWAIESGWTQGWIVSVLTMRQLRTSLWDLTHDSQIERHHVRLRREMMPDGQLQALAKRAAGRARTVTHEAVGKSVQLSAMPSHLYPGLGTRSLTDGVIGDGQHASGLWLGFHGEHLRAVIDLGVTQPIHEIAARFLKSVALGIYLPVEVRLEVSDDGERYRAVPANERAATHETKDGPLVETVRSERLDVRARYVRVVAKNVATIPSGHPAAGRRAWLFADEIMINLAPEVDSR